jgi:hypothetical protein
VGFVDPESCEAELVVPREGGVRVGERWFPQQWTARYWDDRLTVRLAMVLVDDEPVCRGVAVEVRGEATTLRPADLRIPFARFIEAAINDLPPNEPGRLRRIVLDAEPKVERRRRARRQTNTDERMQQIAAVYRQAVDDGRPPTRAVAEALNVSRSTAGHLVVLARRRGFLRETAPRVAGETPPKEKKNTRRTGRGAK